MYRIMICFIIVILSVAGGYAYSWRFSRRIAVIKDAGEKLNTVEREMMFCMETLPSICGKLAETEGPFSTVFSGIRDRLTECGESFSDLWREEVNDAFKKSFLKNEQIDELASLGAGLGKGDIEEQKKCFARINNKLEKLLNEAEEESKRLKKMYMSLFIFGGTALSIILI